MQATKNFIQQLPPRFALITWIPAAGRERERVVMPNCNYNCQLASHTNPTSHLPTTLLVDPWLHLTDIKMLNAQAGKKKLRALKIKREKKLQKLLYSFSSAHCVFSTSPPCSFSFLVTFLGGVRSLLVMLLLILKIAQVKNCSCRC